MDFSISMHSSPWLNSNDRFRAFGPLRYARITMDHDIGRSRGTGFVCFWNKEDADKAVEQSDILRRETTGNEVVTVCLFLFASAVSNFA